MLEDMIPSLSHYFGRLWKLSRKWRIVEEHVSLGVSLEMS